MPRLFPRPILALSAAAVLAACAQSPEAIAPVSMGNAFATLTCADARQMHDIEQPILAALEGQQRQAVTGDALGVFLIGVPMSSLTGGDVAGQIAASRGKIIALQARLAGC